MRQIPSECIRNNSCDRTQYERVIGEWTVEQKARVVAEGSKLNPYCEALFRTVKHTAAYPHVPFADVAGAPKRMNLGTGPRLFHWAFDLMGVAEEAY
jgi:hypothetical protein